MARAFLQHGVNVRRHAPKWRRFALTSLLYAHRELRTEARSLKEVRAFYIEKRIDDQHAYYKKQYEKAAPKSAFFQHIGHWMSWAALIAVAIAFGVKFLEALDGPDKSADNPEGLLYMIKICIVFFLPVALPLIAGISNSLSSSLDLSRRKVRYKEMADLFDRQRNYLAEINDEQVLEQTVCRIEEVLLDEQIEWMASAESGQSH